MVLMNTKLPSASLNWQCYLQPITYYSLGEVRVPLKMSIDAHNSVKPIAQFQSIASTLSTKTSMITYQSKPRVQY